MHCSVWACQFDRNRPCRISDVFGRDCMQDIDRFWPRLHAGYRAFLSKKRPISCMLHCDEIEPDVYNATRSLTVSSSLLVYASHMVRCPRNCGCKLELLAEMMSRHCVPRSGTSRGSRFSLCSTVHPYILALSQ